MKKSILAISVLIFALAFPVISLGGGDDHGKSDEHHNHGKKHSGYAHMVLSKAEKLNLSNDQLGSIMRIHLDHKKIRKELMKKLHNSMVEAHKGLMNPSTQDNAIRAASKNHIDALNKMVDNALKERSEVNNVLTKEQKDKLISMKKEHKMEHHHDEGGHEE
ncbi:conserved hypothetical protein [Nitrosococcus halophilus Nc 4]|uniref:Zinc resistance-associated protein n=1 Tax=Nitrosococcus halophilus (strain Nc4) TaxID=472759 RepID=D5C1Y6_NITHN|nr:Spy/CpxP family protein refolding chaperone [Nitrosococcus halophilus]ADE16574.1 conserved hypothetical protein [Nitrosococcus halophilus Nc 4]